MSEFIRLRMLLHIALIATYYHRNPFRGLKDLRAIKAKRQSFQGLQPIRKYIRSGKRYYFSDNIPGWPSQAFKGFCRSEIMRVSGQKGIRIPFSTVFMSITSKCPLRCPHCYELDNLSLNEVLTTDDLQVILKKIKDYGTYHLQFSGGEPLERLNDLLMLVGQTCKKADIWINTSGFGLTQEIAHSLKKAGLTGAEISLDHWKEEEHNAFRCHPESFFWVREAVKNCNAAGILTSLSLCATGKFISKDNMDNYIEQAMQWGVRIIRLLEPRETLRFRNKDTYLQPGQIALLEEYYRNASSPGKPLKYPLITYPAYHSRKTGCTGGGHRYIYIDPKGNIHPCPFCRRPAGNAVTDPIEDAVDTLKALGCQKYGYYSAD
jgi:MoaA/NifB/PqqE/SkfB family radical SAM enzyme